MTFKVIFPIVKRMTICLKTYNAREFDHSRVNVRGKKSRQGKLLIAHFVLGVIPVFKRLFEPYIAICLLILPPITPGIEQGQALADSARSALCCHSDESRALIPNPPIMHN